MDPSARTDAIYPFILGAPVSPLSVATAPVYLETYTDENTFWIENEIPRSS